MSKKNIIITCMIITIAIILIFIYYILRIHDTSNNIIEEVPKNSSESNYSNIKIENKEILETSNKDNKTISPSAKLKIIQYYKKCGHIVEEEYNVPEDIVNMNEDEVKRYYNDCKVNKFSEDNIEIYKENDEICREHYIAKDNNGYITIYNENENGEKNIFRETDILTKYLPEEDREKLDNGIKIIGNQNLVSFLEDFE